MLVHRSPIPKLLLVEVTRMVQLLLSLVQEVGGRFGRSLELLTQQRAGFRVIWDSVSEDISLPSKVRRECRNILRNRQHSNSCTFFEFA